jgi:hypothetical protein
VDDPPGADWTADVYEGRRGRQPGSGGRDRRDVDASELSIKLGALVLESVREAPQQAKVPAPAPQPYFGLLGLYGNADNGILIRCEWGHGKLTLVELGRAGGVRQTLRWTGSRREDRPVLSRSIRSGSVDPAS